MSVKLNEGDIFEFSINENSTAYGQVVSIPNKESLTIIIFESLYRTRPLLDEIIEDEIFLLGNTFDAKFYHKHWMVIGNVTSNLNDIKLPYYKVGTDPVLVESFQGEALRKATKEEAENLLYRPYVAPVRYELALKARYKILDWKEQYDELLYSKAVFSRELVGNNV